MAGAVSLSRTTLHKGRILDVGLERVRLPGGHEAELEIIRHPGAAAVVPLTGEGEILMLRQYRHAAGGYLWEIPAGTLAAGEEPAHCAARELEEEAGVRAGELVELGEVVPAPGYTTERIHLFLARGLSGARQSLEEDEVVAEVRPMPATEVVERIVTGSIVDGKTIVAVLRARERGLLPTITRGRT